MSIINLPQEILENIFYYCDYRSFINFTHTCKSLYRIYKSYCFDYIPKYIGIIKLYIRYPNETENLDSEEDSDNEEPLLTDYFSTFTKEKIKYIITEDIEKLYNFFYKYSDGNYTIKDRIYSVNQSNSLNMIGTPKKIKFYFSKFELGEKIVLNNMYHFTKCILDFSTRRDIINERLFNDYIGYNGDFVSIPLYKASNITENRQIAKIKFFSELDYMRNNYRKFYKNKVNYIKKYLGDNKINNEIILLKTSVKEHPYYNFNLDLINTTSLRFIKKNSDNIEYLIKEDILDCELLFKLKCSFIDDYKTDFDISKIITNKSIDLV